MKKIQLSNGYSIDILGSGTNTFGKVDRLYNGDINGDTTEILQAIDIGYRHFDTAISYRNETVLGKALKESKLPRELFYITSKIPGREPYITDVAEAVNSSLENLGVESIDLYLIHHPWDDLEGMLRVWRVLEGYVSKGFIKSLGVSNFNEVQLQYLMDHVKVKPVVNQIESHPSNWNDALIEYTQSVGVVVEAWGPLTRISDEAKTVLADIGNKYNKTWAQVCLRYQIERDVVVIPKSHKIERQQENFDIFDFELSVEDRDVISKL